MNPCTKHVGRLNTGWAVDFMSRSKNEGRPFYVYLPYTQVHNPTIPDAEYAGKTKRGNWADILTQMDDFTGKILDTLDELGLAEDTIVVWASDNGADTTYRMPVGDPDPFWGQWHGFSGPWRGGLFTALEGSNRTPCIVRWPGKVPAGKVSNELVHTVDWFTTLLHAAGATVPGDRMIDGMDMRGFLLGDAEGSGRDAVLCMQANRLQAVKWHQWKAVLFKQDDFYSTWVPNNMPMLYNLEWDPREEHQVDFPHAWVIEGPIGAVVGAFLKSLAAEPRSSRGPPTRTRRPDQATCGPRRTFSSGPSSSSSRSPPHTTGFPTRTTGWSISRGERISTVYCQRILAAEAEDEHVSVRWADDAMWATRGDAKPIATVYGENGVYMTPAGKGPGSRIQGWQRWHTYLAEGPACLHHRAQGWDLCPMVHVFRTCKNLLNELENLPHATTGNPEDADSKAPDMRWTRAGTCC